MYGIVWPRVPAASPTAIPVIAAELERTQWFSADELASAQRAQLASLLVHAAASVPHYRQIDPSDVASVPILTRTGITAAGDTLLSRTYPSTHGAASAIETSRTSGAPVRLRGTGVVAAMHGAMTLRDHAWHRRDVHAHLASIRYMGGAPDADPPDGQHLRGWGAATEHLAPEAPLSLLSIATTTDQQLAWLVRTNPTYLLVYPSVLDALLRAIKRTAAVVPALRQIRTLSEVLTPETRALCREVLGVPIVDTYSAQEVGYMALQCPDREDCYHVQSEHVLVEVLRDDGTPCSPGEIGRVIVTDLHNFATPILRYEIGDYAEVAAPCSCGRALPALARIVGRRRNMLVYPDGTTTWPLFSVACREAARYEHLQLLQPSPDMLVARVLPDGNVSVDSAALTEAIHRSLGEMFSVDVQIVSEISRTPAGKLDEFISSV
ncbi:phenylacetate--CoA ligase family protein [soil metagenome]